MVGVKFLNKTSTRQHKSCFQEGVGKINPNGVGGLHVNF